MTFLIVFEHKPPLTGEKRTGNVDLTVSGKRPTAADLEISRDVIRKEIGPGTVIILNIIELGDSA